MHFAIKNFDKTRLLPYIMAVVLLFLSSCSQKKESSITSAANDSVKKYLALAGNSTIAFEKRIKYTDKAYSFIDLKKNDSLTRVNIYAVCCSYNVLNVYSKLNSLSKVKIILLALQGAILYKS